MDDDFIQDWVNEGNPWCDKCGLPCIRGSMGITVHVTEEYLSGVPVEKDESGHKPSMRKWWESQ